MANVLKIGEIKVALGNAEIIYSINNIGFTTAVVASKTIDAATEV